MLSTPLSTLLRTFVLAGLAYTGIGAAQAQKVIAKTTDTNAVIVAKSKGLAAVPNAPQPVSPAVSAPQQVVAATGMATEGMDGWLSDLGAARAQAKATNRPILAVFSGSDWCKPCIMYEQEVFAKPEFAEYAKSRLVLAHFDFPRLKKNQPSAAQLKLNEAAAEQLNREGDYPLAVIIAPDGKVLAKTGYIAGGPAAFEAYLKKVVPSL